MTHRLLEMEPPTTTPLWIMVAEDDLEARRLLSRALRRDGHRVTEVEDGNELMACLGLNGGFATMGHPDVLITDVRMPGITGMSVVAELRDWGIQLPVIIISAFADRETHIVAKLLGALAVFNKPFDIDDLRTVVRNLAA